MKRMYAAVILLLIAVTLCVTEYICIGRCTDEYVRRIDNIEQMVSTGNMKKAAFSAREAEKNWKKTVSVIDMLLYHDYVDEIGRNLAALEAYINFEETAEIFATCESTKEQLRSLKESERPAARNII